jgi:peptidoglycan/xylan/chitin deacetylase (PgdA/CDA1 family)
MPALDIHLEGIEGKDFANGDALHLLREIKERRVPVAFSLPPWMEEYWKKTNPDVISLVREVVGMPGNVLGQQGNTHKCKYPHTLVDPWHENRCPYRHTPSKQEQRDLMEAGRAKLAALLGVSPQLYVPPNHLFNHDTLEVASEMRYWFFAVKSIVRLPPYRFGNLVVVPEGDLTRGQLGRAATYIHYDEIDSHRANYEEAVRKATSLNDIGARYVGPDMIGLNNSLVLVWKIVRDAIKLPKKLGRKRASA